MANASGQFDQAVRLWRDGNLDEAEKICRLLLISNSRDLRVFELIGVIAQTRGAHRDALQWFTQAVALDPSSAQLHVRRGAALRAVGGSEDEAIAEFRRAVALQPELADAHHQLGNGLKALHRFEEAVQSLSEATRLAPNDAAAWLNLGVAQMEMAKPADAAGSFRRALEIEPNRPEAHNVLSVALLEKGDVAAAEAALHIALRLRPSYAAAHNNLARVYKVAGRMPEAVAEYRAALASKPDSSTHSNLLYALNFMAELSPPEIFAEHQKWAAQYEAPWRGKLKPMRDRSPERRLRVGFVSPDFVNHAVAFFFESVLLAPEPEGWEITAYSDAPKPDRVTERLRRACDRWRDVATWNDERLAAQIEADQIDVLFDLAGHTARNRLLVFARKAAPIQITWLGYPNTTGLTAMDYRIADEVSDPRGQADSLHSEALVRLPGGFLCYVPPKESPPVKPLPATTTGQFTFGSFSNYAKLSDPCVATWAAVLKRVANSRLVLKSRGFADADVIARVHGRFARAGVHCERVELDGRLVSVAEHLRQYDRIDIGLDPFPYNGTTTTCEALWMGVPVVSLAGSSHVARVGASLLTRVSLENWIANSAEAYVEICAQFAEDPGRLAEIRGNLRAKMERSSLCDAPRFMSELRSAVRECWRQYCADT